MVSVPKSRKAKSPKAKSPKAMSPKAGSPKAGSPRPRAKRPATRVLVRWDDDKDKQLLLTLQYVCNKKKVKVPWELVAKAMGPSFSPGAIVQHLSKIRKSRVEEGLQVPPILTKGGRMVPNQPKGTNNKLARTRKLLQDDNDAEDSEDLDQSYGSDYYDGGNSQKKRKATRQGKSRSRTVTKKARTSVSLAGRKTRGSAAGSKATATDEDEDLQSEKRDSSPEGSPASTEQNYAVGDSMWDLDSDQDTEMETKRSHSAAPTEDAEYPSKVVVLNIGTAGFKKLGLLRGKEISKPGATKGQKGKEMPLTLSNEEIISDKKADEEMEMDHYTDRVDEDLMTVSSLANQSKTKKTIDNTGGQIVVGEQQSGFFIPGSKGSMNNGNLGGGNSGVPAGGQNEQAMMHHGLHDQVDPFAYLDDHSYADQEISGMGPMNAGQGGYAVQDGSFGNQTFNGYIPDMTTPGQGPSTSYATFPGEQPSQYANVSSNGGYEYNQQIPAQMEQDNTGYTIGFADVSLEPAPSDPVLPTRWSSDEFTADLEDLLKFE
ncbi:MAG: hypothetical protein Q9212_006262 [Teloschistes hypoglaucus]